MNKILKKTIITAKKLHKKDMKHFIYAIKLK